MRGSHAQHSVPAKHVGDRILYLVRHGELDMKAYARDPRTAGLTARGRTQAMMTARVLRQLPVDAIYTSTLQRAVETAAIVARELPAAPLRTAAMLCELPGLHPSDDPEVRRHLAANIDRTERVFARFVRPCRRKQSVTVLITHGTLIRYVICRILGVPGGWARFGTSHCGITHIMVSERRTRIFCYNDTGHLPVRLRT